MCSHHCLDCKVKVIIYSESLGFHNKENISKFKKSCVIYIGEIDRNICVLEGKIVFDVLSTIACSTCYCSSALGVRSSTFCAGRH